MALSSVVRVLRCKAMVPALSCVRHALYPSWHLDPIPDRDEVDRLEREGRLEALKVVPVKPAPTDLTVSVFHDPLLKKFTNIVMQWSEKAQARQLMRDTFARIKRTQLARYHAAKTEEERAAIELNPREIFSGAVERCKPVLQLTPIKKGGITYQVPVPVSSERARFMAMKWLIMAGRDKDASISFPNQMARELLDAYHNEGRVVKRKNDLHKICENNKAYAHYRWS